MKDIISGVVVEPVIKRIILQAKKNRNVIAIAIFGSYARGEKYNDIDICVFLKNREYKQLELSKLRLSLLQPSQKYDVQIFQQLPLYIRQRILKEAKFVFYRDEDALYDLYFITLKQLNDYKHHYEEYLEEILHE